VHQYFVQADRPPLQRLEQVGLSAHVLKGPVAGTSIGDATTSAGRFVFILAIVGSAAWRLQSSFCQRAVAARSLRSSNRPHSARLNVGVLPESACPDDLRRMPVMAFFRRLNLKSMGMGAHLGAWYQPDQPMIGESAFASMPTFARVFSRSKVLLGFRGTTSELCIAARVVEHGRIRIMVLHCCPTIIAPLIVVWVASRWGVRRDPGRGY